MTQRLCRAYKALSAAEDKLAQALKRFYPPCAPVRWLRGGRIRSGVVVRNCYGDRLQVENSETGKQPFITAYDILEAGRFGR